jgi:hypothetical protein
MELKVMRTSFLSLCIILLWSCAQVRTPTGGDKDIVPPRIISASPKNMTTDYSGTKIVLTFDEYVVLEQAKNQILFSPPLAKDPDVKLKSSRILTIDLGENILTPNTTYTINLGEAIKDINEGNVLADNVFLFSTGSYIDSLSIHGKAVSARFQESITDVSMLAFLTGSDSIALGRRPRYVTRCDGQGNFHFGHMAKGDYELIGLLDVDKDLRVDKNEAFGFLLDPVSAHVEPDSNLILSISALDSEGHTFKRAEWTTDGRSVLITSRGNVDSLHVLWPADREPVHKETWGRKDSVRYWFAAPLNTGELTLVTSTDTKVDSLKLGRVTENVKPWAPGKSTLNYSQDSLRIRFDRPISKVDTSLVHLLQDSIRIPYQLIGKDPMQLELTADWQYGANYSLDFLKAAVTDIYGSTSDSLTWPIKVPTEASLGRLNLQLILDPGNYLIYLINKDKKPLYQTKSTGSFTWKLPPMAATEFWIWVVMDIDFSGDWTAASYLQKRLPEPIYYRSESIKLRANWEMELQVIPTFNR